MCLSVVGNELFSFCMHIYCKLHNKFLKPSHKMGCVKYFYRVNDTVADVLLGHISKEFLQLTLVLSQTLASVL